MSAGVWRLCRVSLILGLGLLAAACHQNGTVFAVDTTADTVDITPGDGVCADVNGECSLRAAVMEANALPAVEEIRVDVAAVLDDTVEVTASVVFTGDGSVQGPRSKLAVDLVGAGLVEFDGLDFATVERGISVDAGSVLTVSNLDVRDAEESFVEVNGGAVFIESSSIRSGGYGAVAIDAVAGIVRVENLTTSLEEPYGSVGRRGVAIRVADAHARVVSSTLVGASVEVTATGSGTLALTSSILHDGCSGAVQSGGFNLVYRSGCGFTETGDQQLSRWPFSGGPGEHGGGGLTFALRSDHPAVDAGPESDCTTSGLDAHDAARPGGSRCDIGAFELEQGECGQLVPGADLHNCILAGHDLRDVELDGANLSGANLTSADLRGASLVGTDLAGAVVDLTDFSGADLTDASLFETAGGFFADDSLLMRADLRGAAARSAERADFTDADGRGFATWAYTGSIVDAHIEGADFTGASFWGVISGGVTGTATGVNVIRGYVIAHAVQLDGVDFSDYPEDVAWGNFSVTNSNLSNLRITASWATGYDGSTLDGSDFSGTYADNSRFRGSSLVDVDMTGAQVESTAWDDAVVIGVDFTDASLDGAGFHDATVLLNTWNNTICPSGVNSDDNGGNCDGQFTNGAPSVGGGAVVPALLQGMSVEEFGAGGVVDE